jgi:hypothetical protein
MMCLSNSAQNQNCNRAVMTSCPMARRRPCKQGRHAGPVDLRSAGLPRKAIGISEFVRTARRGRGAERQSVQGFGHRFGVRRPGHRERGTDETWRHDGCTTHPAIRQADDGRQSQQRPISSGTDQRSRSVRPRAGNPSQPGRSAGAGY